MGRYPIIFLESFPVSLLVGALLGFLSGLGVGGGSLLVLWLTQVLAFPQEQAQGINLLFFLPAALISSAFHGKKQEISWHLVLPAVLTGIIAAGLCAFWACHMDTALLRKLFGGLLIAVGLKELFGKS